MLLHEHLKKMFLLRYNFRLWFEWSTEKLFWHVPIVNFWALICVGLGLPIHTMCKSMHEKPIVYPKQRKFRQKQAGDKKIKDGQRIREKNFVPIAVRLLCQPFANLWRRSVLLCVNFCLINLSTGQLGGLWLQFLLHQSIWDGIPACEPSESQTNSTDFILGV